MFRSMFRVLVVASVVLSLTVFAVPSVQAEPSKTKAPAVKSDPGLLQAVVSWLLGTPKPKAPRSTTAAGQNKSSYGSCIDPLGNPRPCP
jgi:hypothetical protein